MEVVGVVMHAVNTQQARGRGDAMNAIVVKANQADLQARRDRALASVQLDEDELRRRIERGVATPDERDAWEEVDIVAFLLEASRSAARSGEGSS